MDSYINEEETLKDPLKIFLIVSNQKDLNDKIEYCLESGNKVIILDKLFTKFLKNNKEDFTISIYFSYIDKLDKNNFDEQTKKYKAIVILKYNNNIFKGFFLYKRDRSNFIYDLKFEENDEKIFPPIYLNLTKLEQLKLYSELLKDLKIKQGEPLSKALLNDSQLFLKGNNSSYHFDFYLELLKQCYSKKEIKTLLMMFKLNRVILPNEMKVKDYSSILKMIEKKPNIIIKYCSKNDNEEKYYKIFYTLLLYFYSNYDSEEVSNILSKKELWKYYVEILPMNHKYFSNIVLSEELINEILKQEKLNYEIIKGALSYLDSFEKILIIINKNIEMIFECLKKEGKNLKLSEFISKKLTDNIKIGSEIEKILKFESEKKEEFIILEKDFLKNYINIDNEVEDKDCPLPATNQNEKEIKCNENIKANQMNEKMKDKNNDFKDETKEKNLFIFVEENNKKKDNLKNLTVRKEEENINYIIQKERNSIDEKEKKEDGNKIEKKEEIKINNKKEYNQDEEKTKKDKKMKLNNKKDEMEEELIKINNQKKKNENNNEKDFIVIDKINTNEINKNIYQTSIKEKKIEKKINSFLAFFNSKNIKMEAINKGEKIKQRLLMPAIGNVSVGKSYFLNSLFGINFCQVKSQITTKFILFIRHIDNLNEPKLYQLFPIENKNNSYDFIKGNTILGEKQITDKIKEINNLCKNDKEPLFFMLEIEIKSIKNKEFLNKFDFMDVPGLNESGSDYINLYFKYFKNMIKYCLIIFSTENYHSKDSIEIINKVQKNIYVPIENFLLILNKIDKVNGKIEDTIHNFKKILLNYYTFNCYNNTIIPVNSLHLNSEIKIETNFYHYLNYYFMEYINDNTKTDNDSSFLEFIQDKIENIISEPENLELLNEEINNSEFESIKKDLEDFIEEKKGKGYNLMIDLKDKDDLNSFKKFYICFKEKIIVPENSYTLKEINKYFNEIKDYSLPKQEEKTKINEEKFIFNDSEEHKLLRKLNEFFKEFFDSQKLKKFGVIINLLNNDYKILKNYILNSSLLFVPILGASNSGKSSFINCLLQKDILTCDSSECTRRGIIIRYIEDKNKISLYSIKFKKDINETFNQYYYYTKENLLSNKVEHIKEIIQILNENYPSKEEDCFLLLEINIPTFDDLQLEPEIKNNICLIDFPGHNTNNNLFFEKEIYQNVLKMSTSFIYMNNGKAFKEDSNKLLLSKLFREVISTRIGDISPKEFIDSCLFVFNKADSLGEEEKNLDGIQNEVTEILDLPKEFDSKFSCTLFSSKIYKNFIKESNKYRIENFNSLLEKCYKKFKKNKDEYFLNYFFKNIYKMIKSEIIDFSNDEDKNISSDIHIKISQKIENFYSENALIKDINYNNNILKISNLLTYYNENIKKSNFFIRSYATETFNIMQKNIIKASNLKRNEYINHLERCFYFLNILFRIENSFKNAHAKEDLDSITKNIKNNINDIFLQFNCVKIINKYKKYLLTFIDNQQKNFKNLIKVYNNDLDKILNYINNHIKDLIKELNDILEDNLENMKKAILKEMGKYEISEKIIISNAGFSLKHKILIGGAIIISLPFALAYGVLWKLPSSLIKSLIYLFKQKEKKFNDYLKNLKEEINNMMEKNLLLYTLEIVKYENSINEVIKRFNGLIAASYIQTDDSYNEAKEKYLKIYEYYQKIKNIK